MEQFNVEQNGMCGEHMEQRGVQNEFQRIGMAPKKVVSYCAIALFILAVVVIGVQTVIDILVMDFMPEIADYDWYIWAVTALSLILIGYPVYYFILKKIPDTPKGMPVKMKPSRFVVVFFISVAAMYITNFIGSLLTIWIAFIKGKPLISPATDAILNSSFIYSLIYAAVLAPVFEELIFRKLLLDKLRRFGDLPAILMTGIAFGLFHMNLTQIFYATVLGFIFAYITIQTNTVRYSILLHMMINFIATIMSPLVSQGNIAGILLIYVWVMIALTLGIVFFILNYRKIKLEKRIPVMKLSSYFLNTGTLLYGLVCIVMIVIATVR